MIRDNLFCGYSLYRPQSPKRGARVTKTFRFAGNRLRAGQRTFSVLMSSVSGCCSESAIKQRLPDKRRLMGPDFQCVVAEARTQRPSVRHKTGRESFCDQRTLA